MNAALERFFNKINFNLRDEFINAKVLKVVVNKKKETWDVYIENDKVIHSGVVEELIKVASLGTNDVSSIKIIMNYNEINNEDIENYFKEYLLRLTDKNPSLISLNDTNISINGNTINIDVISSIESYCANNKTKVKK